MAVLSLIVLLLLCTSIVVKNKKDYVVHVAFVLKILAGLLLGILYKSYLGGGDTFQYYGEAKTIATYLFKYPNQLFTIYFRTINLVDLAPKLVFFDQPRALLFAKIISVFYIFCGGNYWIISAFLSVINFICVHQLVKELKRSFGGMEKIFALAFYFLPTFVFWTSGLLKESLAFGALAILIAAVLQMIRTGKYGLWSTWMYVLVSGVILWELKYYYAAVALPVLISLLVYSVLRKRNQAHPFRIIIVLFGAICLISTLHYNLAISRIFTVVFENYQAALKQSGDAVIHYHHFDGSWYGFLINIPLGLFSGLFRPLMFDVSNALQGIVMIENLVILGALIFGLWKSKFLISLRNPYMLATLCYVCTLAVFLAFAAPNLGTLSRYKVGYWPFFVALVLALFFDNKKGQIYRGSDPIN